MTDKAAVDKTAHNQGEAQACQLLEALPLRGDQGVASGATRPEGARMPEFDQGRAGTRPRVGGKPWAVGSVQERKGNQGAKNSMKSSQILAVTVALIALSLPACNTQEAQADLEEHKIVVTSPMGKEVIVTQQYVCQIHSRRHIKVRALQNGYLEEIRVNEGQAVKKGELMFKIVPTLYQARLDAELAEAKLAELELKNTEKLFKDKVVSWNEVALFQAKLEKAKAKAKLAQAELYFTSVRAPFDGIIDRLHEQLGSLIKEGDNLTTLSDNSVMWVYFNVPEARYLDYMAGLHQANESRKIELVLANGSKFQHSGQIGAIEAKFNNETGNIPFRADFPNPDRLLRHGQTGTVLIHRTLKNAIVIPQRATFEILDKRYVYVVGEDHVVHQREIAIQNEMDDIFVIKGGLKVNDKIVLEGVRQVRDGEKVEYEFRKPEEALANQKHHAE
jgi:membrane fusion protein (multidrug efflux system)